MTRRGLLTCIAVGIDAGMCLALLPMRWNPLIVLALWLGSTLVIVLVAFAIDEAMWRHEQREMGNRVVREARRVMERGTR